MAEINTLINTNITEIITKTIHHTINDPTPILLKSSIISENAKPWENLPVFANLHIAIVENNENMINTIKLIIRVIPREPAKPRAKSEGTVVAPPIVKLIISIKASAAPVTIKSAKNTMTGIIE